MELIFYFAGISPIFHPLGIYGGVNRKVCEVNPIEIKYKMSRTTLDNGDKKIQHSQMVLSFIRILRNVLQYIQNTLSQPVHHSQKKGTLGDISKDTIRHRCGDSTLCIPYLHTSENTICGNIFAHQVCFARHTGGDDDDDNDADADADVLCGVIVYGRI